MLNVTIDGIKVQVKEGSTILQAAQSVGIEIPTLCYLKDLTPEASCRICLVEIEGNPKLFTACSTPVAEGNVIHTKSGKVIAARRSVLDLMLSTHRADCFSCAKNGECQLQNLCYEYGVEKTSYEGVRNDYPIDDSNEFFTYDPQQCILCQRCVNVCQKLHGESAIGIVNRGFKAKIATPSTGCCAPPTASPAATASPSAPWARCCPSPGSASVPLRRRRSPPPVPTAASAASWSCRSRTTPWSVPSPCTARPTRACSASRASSATTSSTIKTA